MKSIRILTILITSLLIYNAESVFCQDYLDIVKTYGNNYFELKRNLEDYFNQYDSLKVIKGSGYKEFVRWDLFWQDRIDSSGDFSLTDISLTNHLLELINNPEIYKGSSEYLYTWNCIGPDSNDRPNAFSSQGLISSIWVDTSNFMTVLAGSNSGGLFVTDDNGDHWMALNDHIPTLGAESIAVNHLNKDVIYVGTGAQNNVLGIYNGYSYGVLLSNDRGISWDTTGMNKFTFHYQTPSGLKYESYTCGDIIMNPSDTSCLYLLVNRKGNYTNLMKSNDRASTWDSIYAEQNVLFNDIEFKPNDPTVIYLAGEKLIKLSGNPIQGTDLTSLLQLEQGYSINRLEAAVTKDDPQILYVLCYSTHSDWRIRSN